MSGTTNERPALTVTGPKTATVVFASSAPGDVNHLLVVRRHVDGLTRDQVAELSKRRACIQVERRVPVHVERAGVLSSDVGERQGRPEKLSRRGVAPVLSNHSAP